MEAVDFRDESDALHGVLLPLMRDQPDRPTQFKQWTAEDVVRHLHTWNHAALLTLQGGDRFEKFYQPAVNYVEALRVREFERLSFGSLHDVELLDAWHRLVGDVADAFQSVNPKQRLAWGGPPMSARTCISARLMETWAHGQAIYDLLGVERVDTDRIKAIAVLGVNTFAWSFSVRGEEVPLQKPSVRLRAPSGDVWHWENPASPEFIEGTATEFCQVVTQVRNIEDTALQLQGAAAGRWMQIAQCFAGPAHLPPTPGSRFRAQSSSL